MNTMPLEADTRLLIDRSLENLGWNLTGKDKNVFFEQPKTEEEQRKLEYKRPDYVLYSKDHEPLIVIEAKRRGGRIDKALEQGIFYAERLKAPLVFATDGVFCKSFHTYEHKTPLLNGNELDEFIRQALAMKFLNGAEINTVSPKVQYDRKELIQVFDHANNLLRGVGLSAGLERFSEFSNILFLKLLSEKGVINDAYSWETIKEIPLKGRIDYINSTVFKALNEYYNDTMEIFTPLSMKDNDILDEIIKSLDPLTLTDVDSDIKGDAFEYFLKASTASGNDLGEYFTPRHIVKTMVRLVNPQFGEKVYDPFCGTGGFLIESFRHIWNNMPRNPHNEEILREHTIYGTELTSTARIAKMNMILAGDGHSGIKRDDSLKNPVNGLYDVVLANMPYSQKTKWGNLYDLPSNNGDSICVQHCMKAINSASENGRMALVVPEGFLFRKDLAKVREYMLDRCELKSIISLPQGVFLPYTGVKTNIIYAEKVNQKIPSSQKGKHYWYFEVKNDGFSLDNYRRKLNTPSDLQKFEEYRKLDENERNTMLEIGFDIVPFDKVKEKDFNFVGSRYREVCNSKNNFELQMLNEIANIKTGNSAPQNSEAFNNGIFPFVRVSDLANYHQTTKLSDVRDYITQKYKDKMAVFPKGTIIFPKSGASCLLNHRGILSVDACISSHLIGIICNKNLINEKYLYFYLCNLDSKSIVLNESYPSIRKEDIENLLIPLPPLEVQEKIVAQLEDYQNIIDGAKKVIENYKPNIIIDKNYSQYYLEQLVNEFKSGFATSQHNKDNEGIIHIRPMNINVKGELTLANSKFINVDNKTEYLLKKNDVLFNNTNSKELVGKTCFIKEDLHALYSNHMTRIRVNSKKIIPEYLALYLHNLWQTGYFMEQCHKWIGQAGISIEELKQTPIYLPPLEEQKMLVNIIRTEQELIRPAYQIIEVFTQKIQDTIDNLFKE